ncbi:MAG: hypothetical protein DSY46_02700 [Hydrogenimonas sp.]|nr:MAG: hypothetical protein DSY46_02700 [Hydrogenimonas sp.]
MISSITTSTESATSTDTTSSTEPVTSTETTGSTEPVTSTETTSTVTVETTTRTVAPYSDNPLLPQQWYFIKNDTFYNTHNINADAHIHPWPTQTYTGKGIKVVVIDDALDTTHEDLQGAVVETYDLETRTTNVRPKDNSETHGTAVTGLIGASSNSIGISGIAPGVELYFIRLPFNSTISDSVIVEAFQKAKEWGADVVNCSWGTGSVSDAVKSAIIDLARNGRNGKGTIIVFASGNGGIDEIGDPIGNDESGIDEVIAVSATNINNERTAYSNYGPQLDLVAPGGEHMGLATLDLMGYAGVDMENYIEYDSSEAFGGTSAATPIVTGVVALLLEANSSLTRDEVIQILENNADKIDPTQCTYDSNGHSDYCGYGKVNVERTIRALIGG